MKKLYAALRLNKKGSKEIQREQSRPAADTPERRALFAQVDRMVERMGLPEPIAGRSNAVARCP
jgi:hypothetical protein